METAVYATDVHIRERQDSRPDDRLYECWLSGATNIFPCLEYRACCTPSQAIQWNNDVELRAWQHNHAAHIDNDGTPVHCVVVLTQVRELRF